MYEGDSPLAEKRAAALALDPALLSKLLGTVELRELLDPEIIAQVHAQLQRTAEDRRARTTEEVADLLRLLGPIPVEEMAEHTNVPLSAIESLGARVMRVRIGGREHFAQPLDAPLLRDALGVPVPPGVPAQQATITDALQQLVSRWARTRGPFVLRDLQDAFGLSASTAHTALQSIDTIVEGRYRQGIEEAEYCAAEVLRTIRSRSLAAARAATEPVSAATFGRFLPDWQQVAPVGKRPALRGADGVFSVIEQLAGVRLPASAWESLILPARVGDYSPTMLDELTANGEVLIVGAGKAGANDPWIMLLPADYAAQLAPQLEPEELGLSMLQSATLEVLQRGGSFLFGDILSQVPGTADELREALWSLVEMGLVSPDSFAPIRTHVATAGSRSGATAHRAKRRPTRSRLRMGRTSFAQSQRATLTPPDVAGRWVLAVPAASEATARSLAHGEAWLDRYGVVTRGSVVAEDVLGGFALAYKVLSGFEESGKAMRGYVIDGLGAAQFSTPAVIDRLRGLADSPDVTGWPSGTQVPQTYLLAAADPANPYGAALPWPETEGSPTRAAGALVVLVDGLPIAHLTRGGKTLTTFPVPAGIDDGEIMGYIVAALTEAVASGRLSPLTIEKANGASVFETPLANQLREQGAGITPKGVRISGKLSTSATPSRRGRSLSDALESVPKPEPGSGDSAADAAREGWRSAPGGFRPRGYRR